MCQTITALLFSIPALPLIIPIGSDIAESLFDFICIRASLRHHNMLARGLAQKEASVVVLKTLCLAEIISKCVRLASLSVFVNPEGFLFISSGRLPILSSSDLFWFLFCLCKVTRILCCRGNRADSAPPALNMRRIITRHFPVSPTIEMWQFSSLWCRRGASLKVSRCVT